MWVELHRYDDHSYETVNFNAIVRFKNRNETKYLNHAKMELTTVVTFVWYINNSQPVQYYDCYETLQSLKLKQIEIETQRFMPISMGVQNDSRI